MTSMASSLGSTLGGTFMALVGGPIGLATSAVQGLLSLLDDGSESVGKLGEYWESASGPIKDTLAGVVNSAADWVAGMAEMVKSSEYVTEALEILDVYSAAAFESIMVAIDKGVDVFYQFYAAAKETGQGVVIILGDVYASIQKTFGSESVATAVSWGESIQTWVVDKIELVGIFVRNWPDVFEMAGLKIQEVIINIGEYMGTIPANAAIVGNYIANNWVKLLTDAFNAVGTGFKNLGTNLVSVWQAFLDFVKTGKFEVNFKPILEGFVATADALPEMVKPKLTSMADQIQAIADRIAAAEAKGYAKHKLPGKAAEAAPAAEFGAFKTESFGVAELASRMRAGILNPDKEDNAKKTASATERTAKATEEIAKEAKKPKPAVVG